MKFKSALTAFVACAAAVVSYAATTADYVQDGLIAHWDGIANAGKDNPHDSAATTWVDLVGGRAFTLYNVDIEDNGLYFKGTEKSSVATSYGELNAGDTTAIFTTAGTLGTVELVFKEDAVDFANTQAVLLQAPSTAGVQFSRSKLSCTVLGEVKDKYPRVDWVWQDEFESVAVTYKSSAWARFFTNGDEKPASETKSYWAATGTTTMLGTRLTKAIAQTYKGRIYAIRVYNRQLSQEEVVRNAALDAARFLQGDTSPAVFATSATVASDRGETVPAKTEGFNPSLNAKMVVPASGTLTFAAPADEFSVGTARKGVVTGGALYEIDGGETNAVATTKTPTLEYESKGLPLHMVWTVAYSDGIVGAKDFYADPVNGDDDYAGEDIGSAEHPFKTLGKAHIAATNHIKTASAKAVIWLAEGRFDQKVRITFAAGESWIGKGKDKTFINASGCVTTGSDYGYLRLVSSDNLLSSVCVTGFVGGVSKTIWVEKGLVDHCRSAYNTTSANYGKGRGLYLAGGTAQFCEIDHNTCSSMYTEGAGANVCGGTLTDSDIHDNSTLDARFCKGAGINLSKGTVCRCRIWHNGYLTNFQSGELGGGVYLSGGTLENSLVYDNRVLGTGGAGGVHNEGGTVRYCTIVNNRTNGDTTCLSGYVQQSKSAAVAYNNIIVGNYKPGATVSTGTCRTNLLDAAVSGYSLNFVAGIEDVGFVDAKNGDFHIASAASPAVGKALVISAVKTDFEETLRDPAKPTIGAYEYVAAAEDFSATIRVLNPLWREGSAPSVELVVTGAPDESKLSIAWFLDGTEVLAAANQKEPSFAGASLGRHTVKAVATYGTETETDERVDAFTVQPTKVYVNTTGTGTFPFATPETGTNSLNAALEALWKANDETTTVEVDEGTYRLRSVVSLQDRVEIVGKGAEKTHLRGFDTNARLITLDNAGSRLCGLTLTNSVSAGGLAIKSGLVDGCRIIRCNSTEYGGRGAGVNLAGGTLQNSEIVDCTMSTYTGIGGGIAILGKTAVVSNCTIRACRSHCGTREPHNHGGAGVYATNGTVTHCRILDCFEKSNEIATGVAVWSISGPSDTSNFILRNCLIASCTSYNTEAVVLTAGTMESCTVAGNTMPTGVAAVNCGGTVRNCVIWNGCTDIAVNGSGAVSYSCYSNATEGEDGNTASDPKFRGVKHGEYKISSKSKAFRAGTVRGWMTGATDILGNPRLTDGKVDMGCYQVGFDPGLVIMIR